MAKFDDEFEKVILAEGGYVNDPDDAGGETYLGIVVRIILNGSDGKLLMILKRSMELKV